MRDGVVRGAEMRAAEMRDAMVRAVEMRAAAVEMKNVSGESC